MEFQRLSVVRLCTPAEPPPDGPDDDAIQAAHLAYLGSLWEQGSWPSTVRSEPSTPAVGAG